MHSDRGHTKSPGQCSVHPARSLGGTGELFCAANIYLIDPVMKLADQELLTVCDLLFLFKMGLDLELACTRTQHRPHRIGQA